MKIEYAKGLRRKEKDVGGKKILGKKTAYKELESITKVMFDSWWSKNISRVFFEMLDVSR